LSKELKETLTKDHKTHQAHLHAHMKISQPISQMYSRTKQLMIQILEKQQTSTENWN